MTSLDPKLQKLLDRLDGRHGFEAGMKANLEKAIGDSPLLAERMSLAVEQKLLDRFDLVDPRKASGGEYSNKAINLRPQDLQGDFTDVRKLGNMVYVLAHETQHGFNSQQRAQERGLAEKMIVRTAKDADPYHDYTQAGELWKQASRNDESKASIAGWNAVVSQIKGQGKTPTLDEMWGAIGDRSLDFMEMDPNTRTFKAKQGVTLNADNTLAASPENIATIGKSYYDDPKKTVGIAGSSYANYDGTGFFSYAGEQHLKLARPGNGPDPRFVVNMKTLDMQESPIEINGVDFGRQARTHPELQYFDSSDGQLREHYMSHTIKTHQAVTPVAGLPQPPELVIAAPRSFDDPKHPEHALYVELKERLPPGTSPDRLAQITVAASRGGIQAGEVNRVDITDTAVYLTGAIPGDRATVDLGKPPLAQVQSEQQYDALERQRAQQFQPPEPPPPQQNNPTIHR